jgi:hypothetical protein
VAIILWLPRLSGPIDLRWDAGVYYLLGTSLAQGHGYRIPSEPGLPEALQYPPLLPAIVALYERALGTSDILEVTSWLRKSYAALFIAYGVCVLMLAKRYLPSGLAVAAAILSLAHHHVIFLSDLLFTELPFAVLALIFALVSSSRAAFLRPWLRELVLFGVASAGFALRTAGIVLFAAWIIEATLHRRWQLTFARAALALVPIIVWQAYIARVRSTNEYLHPAYEYQRASYQFYNVSYADNISLVDPFQPERGRTDLSALAKRIARNLMVLPKSLGEAISAKAEEWPLKRFKRGSSSQQSIQLSNKRSDLGEAVDLNVPPRGGIVLLPLIILSGFVVAGLVILTVRRSWMIVLIVLGSICLICTTPWPLQFTRYLAPMIPFLAICFFVSWSALNERLRDYKRQGIRQVGRIALQGVIVLVFAVEGYTAFKLFHYRASKEGAFAAGTIMGNSHFFAHDQSWRGWEEATKWLGTHTPPASIVATSAPHLCYLLTNRLSVLPPMEADPSREQNLLEKVPVSYVIADKLIALDVTRRYVLPAIRSYPDHWDIVYSNEQSRVYERNTVSQ